MFFFSNKIIIFIFFIYFSPSILFAADCKKPEMPSIKEWQSWIKEIKILAFESGISKKTINLQLDNVKPASKIIMRDRCQVEKTITLNEYLYYRLDKARIVAGKNMMKKYQKELNLISDSFGIQPRFIIAVLGLESYYGKNQGKISTIEAVATLAFDRRRSNFYKKQLIAALKIIDDDLVSSKNLIGSWGGAIGMVQMIPTTYLDTGYDWDKDGKIDIWNNFEDSFASIANYLTTIGKNPWLKQYTWGREVLPPKNIDEIYNNLMQKDAKGCGAVKSRSIPKKLSEWQKLGFRNVDGNDLPNNDDLETRLIAPDGINERMFLVYPNYKNILYYNCSSYYAVSIGLLSDAIKN
jgi:membrane-bound lytic murein transglycosylase B